MENKKSILYHLVKYYMHYSNNDLPTANIINIRTVTQLLK
jgi:hypothetical protein